MKRFISLVLSLSEDELLNLSKNYGGYPVYLGYDF